MRFKKWDYPGYQNVRGGDINCDKPFPLNSHCFTYKFRVDEKYDDQPRRNDHDDADLMAFHHWVMQRLQNSDTHGLQEFAKNKKARNKKRRAVEFEVGDFVLAVLTGDRFPIGKDNKLAG